MGVAYRRRRLYLKNRTVIRPKYTVHATERTVERLNVNIGDIFKNFVITKYKHRYVDRGGTYHIYDEQTNSEIVGRFEKGNFCVVTVMNSDIHRFYERRRCLGLARENWSIVTED